MANHRKYDLLNQFEQAVIQRGWTVVHLSPSTEYPFRLRLIGENESLDILLYIWNITHGGGNRAENELRVQFTGVDHFIQEAGSKTLILGWSQAEKVFAGFDYNKHSGTLGSSASSQIRSEYLSSANNNGFAACPKGNGELAVAFAPEFLVDYVISIESLHSLGEIANAGDILNQVVAGELEVNAEQIEALPKERQQVIVQTAKKVREGDFNRRVLKAYGYQCAFSGMQLGLLDAAHIVPVKEVGSTDETSNGIALSPLCHRAYDVGLITFSEKYQIRVNNKKILYLQKNGRAGGLSIFLKSLRRGLVLPAALVDRPNVYHIKKANMIRGW